MLIFLNFQFLTLVTPLIFCNKVLLLKSGDSSMAASLASRGQKYC